MHMYYFVLIAVVVIEIVAIIFLKKQMKPGFGPFNLKVYGITIISGFIVLVALYPDNSLDLAPAFGVLGAIAGYIFGYTKDNS